MAGHRRFEELRRVMPRAAIAVKRASAATLEVTLDEVGTPMLTVNESIALGINRTPGVCGGQACIRSTRIPVWLLVELRNLGQSEAELLEAYPGLSVQDLDSAWAYYRDHAAEIAAAIADQNRDDEVA